MEPLIILLAVDDGFLHKTDEEIEIIPALLDLIVEIWLSNEDLTLSTL